MKSNGMYVISITEDFGEPKYMYDSLECGHVFGCNTIIGAKIMSFDEAERIFNDLVAKKDNTSATTDGTIYPVSFIHSGLGISNAKPRASGSLAIVGIKLDIMKANLVKGEIKKPTGFKYD